MAVAPRRGRHIGAVLGATAAVSSAYLSFELRKHAIRKHGQASTGLIEDAVALGAALWVAYAGRPEEPE
jgi:gas vesicle protein